MRQNISFPVFVFCFAAAGLAAPAPVFCAPPHRRPSVVLVSLCSLRADHTSPYGYAKSATPALSELAKQAVVFENAYANSNWTAAAVASMLTGKRPFSHGLLGYMDSLSPDTPVIQSVLSENGYETAAFLSGLPGESPYGLSRGFGHILFDEELQALSRLVPAAVEWEKSLSPEKDFFMFLHSDDAHSPYRCYSGTHVNNGKFPEANSEFDMYYNGFPGFDLHKLDLEKWKQALSLRGNTAFLSDLSNAYDRCVSRLDKDIAALLSGLGAAGGRPLLVIIVGDHGDLLGEHDTLGRGGYFFEPLVRVPLIIRFPGGGGAQRRRGIAEHADLMPTICAAAGVACPGGLDGKNLAPAGKKADLSAKWAGAAGGVGGERNCREFEPRAAAFLDNGKKLMLNQGNWQLFNLAADPGEMKDIARERPAEFLKMASAYLAFSGVGNLQKEIFLSPESLEDCAGGDDHPLIQDDPENAAPCERARLAASNLARSGDFDGAAAKLAESGCPQADIPKDKEKLDLIRRTSFQLSLRSPMPKPEYKFSVFSGRLKAQSNAFSVSYSTGSGFECEDAGGRPSAAPGCVALASELLNYIEKTRFSNQEKKAAPWHDLKEALRKAENDLKEALRKAGYVQ